MLLLSEVSWCTLSANDIGIMCRVRQWRIVAVVEKAVSPTAVANEEQGCQEH